MTIFHVDIGIYRAFITVDNRFRIEIRRKAPPPMASAQLILRVYPITDGEIWDDLFEVFAVDECRVIELENEARRQQP